MGSGGARASSKRKRRSCAKIFELTAPRPASSSISEGDDDCLVDTPEVNAIKRSKRRVFDDDSDVEYVVPPPDNRKKSRIKKSRKGHNNDLNREDDDVLKF